MSHKPNCKNRVEFSNLSSVVWKGPERNEKNIFELVLLAFQNVSAQSVVGNLLVRINVAGRLICSLSVLFL